MLLHLNELFCALCTLTAGENLTTRKNTEKNSQSARYNQ